MTVPLLLVAVLPPQDLKKKYGAKWALVTVSNGVVELLCCCMYLAPVWVDRLNLVEICLTCEWSSFFILVLKAVVSPASCHGDYA